MINQETQNKLSAIFDDEAIMQKISMSESLSDMQAVFAENGVDLSIEEVKTFIDFMNAHMDGSLSDDELDEVAGGAVAEITAVTVFTWAWKGTKKIARKCWEAGRWFAQQGW